MCVCVCVHIRVCVCVCVCVREGAHKCVYEWACESVYCSSLLLLFLFPPYHCSSLLPKKLIKQYYHKNTIKSCYDSLQLTAVLHRVSHSPPRLAVLYCVNHMKYCILQSFLCLAYKLVIDINVIQAVHSTQPRTSTFHFWQHD